MLVQTDILSPNLSALARRDAALAKRLQETAPLELNWSEVGKGGWTATIAVEDGDAGQVRNLSLASRYDPMAEAQKLISTFDRRKHAGVFILGLGLGHHVTLAAKDMGPSSLLVVYEPDPALLRAVLEKLDYRDWLGRENVVVVTEPVDRASLITRLEKWGAFITQGTALVVHPPTRQLHPGKVAAMSRLVAEVLSYYRTNVATALVNASRTIHNQACNLPWYAAGANTNELHQAAKGFPAICVGAGPSLAKNVDLLRNPAVRRNIVLISAQTTLKPLLDRGIQPDFVTALDYHEISRRFYEGLPDLPGVTLVAEAKANPAILEAFPGPVRVTRSGFLDKFLGSQATPIVPIKDGATVAHLSFYLAQHLGCDPIILIGQDLGFSDGLYYCPGTAVHEVWAPELNQFNTVEMMEWQRIVRHRGHLQKLDDVNGKAIYSDEQMITYLKQFERDFAEARQKVIDASEGGLPKAHTVRMPLAQALGEFAKQPVPKLPVPARTFDHTKLSAAAILLKQRREEVEELAQLSRRTEPVLTQILEHQRDAIRVGKLFKQLKTIQDRVAQLGEAFGLVNHLNTIGAFKRSRADRAIHHSDQSDAFEVQRQQIERDLENIDWLVQACQETLKVFQTAGERMKNLAIK